MRKRLTALVTMLLFALIVFSPLESSLANAHKLPAQTAAPTSAATLSGTAVGTIAPTETPLPVLNHDLMGIQAYGYVGPGDWGQLLDRAYFMGFKWIKMQLSWKELEPTKGQYTQQFEIIRQNIFNITRFRGYGYKVMISIAKAPDWARPASARGNNDGPPANPQDLVDFLNYCFSKFERVDAIEIWNEPNTTLEWTGAPLNGKAYMSLFTPAYKAIRVHSGDIVVISGGPTPVADNPNVSVDDRQWIQQLYDAGLPTTDPNFAIGVHPYGWANPPDSRCCNSPAKGWNDHPVFYFLDTIYDYRAIMVKNHHDSGKLWATEFGWASYMGMRKGSHVDGSPAMPPTDPGLGWETILTDQQQAQYIVKAFDLAQHSDLAQFMGPMFLWNLNFASLPGYVESDKPSRPEAGFSVINADTFPRPAYDLLAKIALLNQTK